MSTRQLQDVIKFQTFDSRQSTWEISHFLCFFFTLCLLQTEEVTERESCIAHQAFTQNASLQSPPHPLGGIRCAYFLDMVIKLHFCRINFQFFPRLKSLWEWHIDVGKIIKIIFILVSLNEDTDDSKAQSQKQN